MTHRRLLPLLLLAAAVPAVAGSSSAGAAAKACKRPASAELLKTGGQGRVWSRPSAENPSDTVYVACSLKYGRKVVLVRDDSGSVDQVFHLGAITVSSRKATLRSCTEYDDGRRASSTTADLKAGTATDRTDEDESVCTAG